MDRETGLHTTNIPKQNNSEPRKMHAAPPIPSEIINWEILNEIVSMDEDDPDFSKNLIIQFLDQAQTTFDQIEQELNTSQDLTQLSSLGHFLKGSSAALGLQRIAWACERIQNYGRKREGSLASQQDNAHYLSLIAETLQLARQEFGLAKQELSKFYNTDF